MFGGSGFYEFLDDARSVDVETPYGRPAASYTIGTVAAVEVAFLPRHGTHDQLPPHLVPFRANVWGMKELGATCIIGPCAVGSLQPQYAPGTFVVCDQLVDWTAGRERTFNDGPASRHISFADPYCQELREVALVASREVGATAHDGGAVVVIPGPRFSTRAESAFFSRQGWAVVNMTQEPEVALSRELEMCYVNISVVTDYDVGVEGEIAPVTHKEVLARFAESLETLKRAVLGMLPGVAAASPCKGEIQE